MKIFTYLLIKLYMDIFPTIYLHTSHAKPHYNINKFIL
ncbi:hypothetical protein BCAH1134_C0040 (plasmid) [Bacillus cereus AH1134]|nr:hypothetical protein BCAH1134_C0040 [Bacillus cereus AH1134]